ncbi:MAG: Quinone oxidoreductase 1 [Chlamydiia bacterium]|nr:Quinone oxidoreductase 1 [Chlamydiia bacterium]
MKAWVINRVGEPDVFEKVEMEDPEPEAGHLVIRVLATSVNQIDCKIRSGAVTNIAPPFPAILHSDVVGVIEKVGEGVERFKVGDEVWGCAGGMIGCPSGALAELMEVDADLMALRPKSLDIRKCAAIPLVGITAYIALFEKLNLKGGENILIHGGCGGVGHIATQLASSHGANVFVTVGSDEDFDPAREFGAKGLINYRDEGVEDYVNRLTNGRGFERIFDTVGGPNLVNSMNALADYGEIVTTAGRATVDLSILHNKGGDLGVVFMLLPLVTGQKREWLGRILHSLGDEVDKGNVRPMVDPTSFGLDDVIEAHRLVESGKARGKVVLVANS